MEYQEIDLHSKNTFLCIDKPTLIRASSGDLEAEINASSKLLGSSGEIRLHSHAPVKLYAGAGDIIAHLHSNAIINGGAGNICLHLSETLAAIIVPGNGLVNGKEVTSQQHFPVTDKKGLVYVCGGAGDIYVVDREAMSYTSE